MFSGSFGLRSIVLCKYSGKYIGIYFKLKITCYATSAVKISTCNREHEAASINKEAKRAATRKRCNLASVPCSQTSHSISCSIWMDSL